MKRKNIFYHSKLYLLLICFVGAFIGGYFFKSSSSYALIESLLQVQKKEPINAIITSLETCKNVTDQNICQKETTAQLLKEYSLQEILTVLEKDESKSKWVTPNCHVITHSLGQNEYRSTRSIEKSLEACTEYCWSGCYHGVAEGYYLEKKGNEKKNIENIVSEILRTCGKIDKNKKMPEYCTSGELQHGTGHVFMHFTNNDASKALPYCDVLDITGNKRSCYNGVFMALFNLEDQKPNSSKKQDPLYPCNQYDEKYTEGCYETLALKKHTLSMEERIKRCDMFPIAYQRLCYREIVQSNQITDIHEFKKGCDTITDTLHKTWCIQGTVSFLTGWNSSIENAALRFCAIVGQDFKKSCYEELHSSLVAHSRDPLMVCEYIKEKEYAYWCK